jgi:hypothetical protein
MIIDHRTYELQPGRLRDFRLVGYFSTEVGNVNEMVHIWAHDDPADRATRRTCKRAASS